MIHQFWIASQNWYPCFILYIIWTKLLKVYDCCQNNEKLRTSLRKLWKKNEYEYNKKLQKSEKLNLNK
jgi:ubiquitin-protein ligase